VQHFRSESAADKRRDDAHPARVEPENLSERLADPVRSLRGLMEGEVSRLPQRDRGVRLHRVVVFHRRGKGLVELHGRGGELAVEVTLLGVGRVVRVHPLRRVQVVPVRPELHIVRLLAVGHADQARGESGGFERLGDRGGHVLAAEVDFGRLEDGQFPVTGIRQPEGVLVAEDGDHAREGLSGACIYPRDPAPRDVALHREEVQRVVETVLVGIGGRPGDFLRPVPAVQRRADRPALRDRGHRSPTVPAAFGL
jgi:hypothetical protein